VISDSYNLDTIEETFDVALKIDLTFIRLVNAKVWCSKYEEYVHYDYQCSLKSQHVSIVPNDDVDSKVVQYAQVPSMTTSVIEDISVGLTHRFLTVGPKGYTLHLFRVLMITKQIRAIWY